MCAGRQVLYVLYDLGHLLLYEAKNEKITSLD